MTAHNNSIFSGSIKVSAEYLPMLVIRRYCIVLEEFQLSIFIDSLLKVQLHYP